MKNIFLSVFEISVSTSLVVAALLIFAPFLNRRYAAKWKYYIWIALAFRLIVPFHVNLPLRQIAIAVPAQITVPVVTAAKEAIPIAIRPETPITGITLLDIIAAIWLVVCVGFLLINIFSYLHYRAQIIRNGVYVEDGFILRQLTDLKKELQIKTSIAVIRYNGAASPMILGFFRPILILPDNEYSNDEMFFILKHELIHLKRHDIYFKLLFVIAKALHWFNPFINIMQKEAVVDIELSCDERVLQGTSYTVRKEYTETLLSALSRQNKNTNALSTQFYGGKQVMKKRFENILQESGKKNGIFVLLCVISMILILGIMTGQPVMGQYLSEMKINNGLSFNEPLPGESLSDDRQEIKRIAEIFATAYFSGDTDTIQSFLTVPFEWDIDVYTETGTISETTLKGLSDIGEEDIGSVRTISLEFRNSNIEDAFHYLSMIFVKQEDGWKIQFYGVEG